MSLYDKLVSHFPTRTVENVTGAGSTSGWGGSVTSAQYSFTIDSIPFEYHFDTPEEVDGRTFEQLEDYVITLIEAYFA